MAYASTKDEYLMERKKMRITKAQRQQLLERANHQCELCRSRERLEIHHMDFDFRNNATWNHQVLCNDCHRRVHDEAGRPWATNYKHLDIVAVDAEWPTDESKRAAELFRPDPARFFSLKDVIFAALGKEVEVGGREYGAARWRIQESPKQAIVSPVRGRRLVRLRPEFVEKILQEEETCAEVDDV